MRWIGKKTTHIALLAVFAVLTGFSLTETETLYTVITSPEGEDALFELVYIFPGQSGEPAILGKADDSGYSILRLANQRVFDIFGHVGLGSEHCFSHFQSYSTKNPFDNKSTIQIKLRI